MDTSKLKNIFARELNKIRNWRGYLNYIGCKFLSHDEKRIDLIAIDYVRVVRVGEIAHWYRIGVPYEFAEKVLVLGGLPPVVPLVPRLTTSGVEWVVA